MQYNITGLDFRPSRAITFQPPVRFRITRGDRVTDHCKYLVPGSPIHAHEILIGVASAAYRIVGPHAYRIVGAERTDQTP